MIKLALPPGTTPNDILDAYEDCGISKSAAFNMLHSRPPHGLGFSIDAAAQMIDNTTPNCGSPTPPVPDPNPDPIGGQTEISSSKLTIPDNFFGFLMLIGGI